MCNKLTPAEIKQANMLGAYVGAAQKRSENTAAAVANDAGKTPSALTAQNEANHAQALRDVQTAVDNQTVWWRSKGFNV